MLIYTLIDLLFKDPLQFFIALIFISVPLLISVTFHEAAHGFVAYMFGDDTPKKQGRLTLNPLAHIDPLGTLMLFIVGIGWAKPVVINPYNIHGRTKQMFVALAGPLSNILLALLFSGCIYFLIQQKNLLELPIILLILSLLNFIVRINIILAIFNMLPIPPLDGSRVLTWILPDSLAEKYNMLEPYGMFILMLLLFTVGFGSIFKIAVILQNYLYDFMKLSF
ncbi:MAG: site-2 protease family protein [Candidatus Gastranaerophilaceae bacterium]|jgi:Zn-dependent protease